MKKLMTLMLVIQCYTGTIAQENIFPTSPQAVNFHRFDSYPVDLSTGVPDISVPLHTIKVSGISIPITARYHASGIKVGQSCSEIGLGWVLSGGGRITRTVYGEPDRKHSFDSGMKEADKINLDDRNDAHFLNQSSDFKLDTQYDIFTINAPGLSGEFILDKENKIENDAIPIPFKPIKIKPHTNSYRINYFEVWDEKGNYFVFGESPEQSGIIENGVERGKHKLVQYISSWLLTRIITANKRDTIDFRYQEKNSADDVLLHRGEYHKRSIYDYIYNSCNTITIHTNPTNPINWNSNCDHCGSLKTGVDDFNVRFDTKILKNISFTNGQLDFIANDKKTKIETIRISSGKQVSFKTSEYKRSNRFKLDTICISGGKNTMNYAFSYRSGHVPFETNRVDYWGYHNANHSKVKNRIPIGKVILRPGSGKCHLRFRTYTYSYGSADRSATEYCMDDGILNKITYPTGGYTTYEYEANRIGSTVVGGLRVKKITHYKNKTAKGITRTYEYIRGNAGKMPEPSDYMSSMWYIYDTGDGIVSWNIRTFGESPNEPELFRPVYYTKVVEYIVEESPTWETSKCIGKNVYRYYKIPEEPQAYHPNCIKEYDYTYNPVHSAFLYNKVSYKKIGDEYKIVESYSYDYNNESSKNYYDLKVKKNITCHDPIQEAELIQGRHASKFPENLREVPFYLYGDRKILGGTQELVSETKTSYYDNGLSTTIKTTYKYDNQSHMLPTQIVTSNSYGDSTEVTRQYPMDLATKDVARYKMLNNNMVNYPLLEETHRGNKLINAVLNDYKVETNPNSVERIVPASIKVWDGSKYETDVLFDKYDDKGNLLQYRTKQGITTSIIWGYNKQYPIAKLEGAWFIDLYTKLYNEIVSKSNADNSKAKEEELRKALNKLRDEKIAGIKISKAMITTYTYDPLIGMTSQTDPNGRTTYYEYDNFGRLKLVRDQDFNVIKKHEYNYATQTSN